MATGTKLQLTFETMSGTKTVSFNYAKPGATGANVKALGAAIIANGAIFNQVPVRLTAAKTVTTSENEYDVS